MEAWAAIEAVKKKPGGAAAQTTPQLQHGAADGAHILHGGQLAGLAAGGAAGQRRNEGQRGAGSLRSKVPGRRLRSTGGGSQDASLPVLASHASAAALTPPPCTHTHLCLQQVCRAGLPHIRLHAPALVHAADVDAALHLLPPHAAGALLRKRRGTHSATKGPHAVHAARPASHSPTCTPL
jgi:hypothetical protein